MVSTKFFLIATFYFTSMKIAHCTSATTIDTTESATTTVAMTTVATTTVATTTKAATTTVKSSSTTCADQITGGSNDCASLSAYCKNSLYLNLMKEKCPKTCGYCTTSSGTSGTSGSGSTSSGCADNVTGSSNDCTSMASYCTNTIYKDLMKQQCPKTCGYCTSSSSSSSSSGSSGTTTCKDTSSDCSSKSYLCKNSVYIALMKTNCPSTCGYC